jgi:hypothetical protein
LRERKITDLDETRLNLRVTTRKAGRIIFSATEARGISTNEILSTTTQNRSAATTSLIPDREMMIEQALVTNGILEIQAVDRIISAIDKN